MLDLMSNQKAIIRSVFEIIDDPIMITEMANEEDDNKNDPPDPIDHLCTYAVQSIEEYYSQIQEKISVIDAESDSGVMYCAVQFRRHGYFLEELEFNLWDMDINEGDKLFEKFNDDIYIDIVFKLNKAARYMRSELEKGQVRSSIPLVSNNSTDIYIAHLFINGHRSLYKERVVKYGLKFKAISNDKE